MGGSRGVEVDGLAALLFDQDNVIARPQALRLMSESRLRWHVDSGRWSRPHRRIYVAHNGPVTARQRTWIGMLAVGNGRPAPLAGTSALTAFGMRGLESDPVHVIIPASMRAITPPAYVAVHRTRILPVDDRHYALMPRTSAARAVVDAARWAKTDDRARAIIASAFQQHLVSEPAVLAALGRIAPVRRQRLIEETAHDAGGGSESISELEFLDLCRIGKLPTPRRQSVVVDASGRRRHRDAYFEEWHLHVEIDGSQHMAAAAWWEDMRRQNEMWIAGDRVLRFPAWVVRNYPEAAIAQIRDALMAAGWREK